MVLKLFDAMNDEKLDEAGEIIEMRVFPSRVLRVEEGRFAENATRTSG
jgi:hypothetical protein